MKKRKLILSIVVSVLLPGIEIVSHNFTPGNNIDPGRIFTSWLTSSLFLFILWNFNQYVALKFSHFLKDKIGLPALALQIFCGMLLTGVFFMVQFVLLPQHFRMVMSLPAWFVFIKFSMGFLIIIAIQQTFEALEQNEAIKLTNAQLLNENLEARLQSLKQQINPHFLFNALSTLRTMVRANDKNAEKFIINLSDVYRQLLNKRDSATIALNEEIEFLTSYVFMLQARFEDTLQVDINILPQSLQKRIPAFSLQLLAENCIKHNIISSAKPLCIKIHQGDADSVIVENNLQVKPSSFSEASGIGISNLEKRYELLNIAEGVKISHTDQNFKVTLKLLQ